MTAKRVWPITDTHHHIDVSLLCTYMPWMEAGQVDIQTVFQVDHGAGHRTPDWNPFVGNDYVAKVQRLDPGRVLEIATINPWSRPPRAYTHPLESTPEHIDWGSPRHGG